MTNETTASQPKSIGDDAQFIRLLSAYDASIYPEQKSLRWVALVEFLDSKLRTPAAQASATIQAAPDESQWVDRCSYDAQVDEWAIERSNLEADAATANRKSLEFKRVSDEQRLQIARLEIALQRAATIQEPVMVAEPVGVTQFDDDWIEKEVFAEFDRNVHKSSNDVIRAVIATAIQMMPGAAPMGAAPMVADPAGVVVQNLELIIARLEQIAGNFTDDYRNAAEEALVCARSLAATVKAVPSEAMSDASAELLWVEVNLAAVTANKAFGQWMPERWLQEFVKAYNFEVRATKGLRAAPLADKTGGGE